MKQKWDDKGNPKTKANPNGKERVKDMYYESKIPNMAANKSMKNNLEFFCKSSTADQLVNFENLYGIKGDTLQEAINKLVDLRNHIDAWSNCIAEVRNHLIEFCRTKEMEYPNKNVQDIAECFQRHSRTDVMRQKIYEILNAEN